MATELIILPETTSTESASVDHEEEEGSGSLRHDFAGYPKLARLMSRQPQAAMFRRFGNLTMLNLLRLQAELHDLEEELQDIRDEDDESDDPIRKAYMSDFKLMRDNLEDGDSIQYEHLVKIGSKLQEYHAALLQAIEVSKIGQPRSREADFLRLWLRRDGIGENFLRERERTMWNDKEDLIVIQPRKGEDDMFTSVLNGALLDLYHRYIGQRGKNSPEDPEGNVRRYSDAYIQRAGSVISATLSSLLPTLAILALYFVKRMLVRIGLVIIFTAIFSLTLGIVTQAKKVEVFSATAAFAAVEVVFVGSTSGNYTI